MDGTRSAQLRQVFMRVTTIAAAQQWFMCLARDQPRQQV
jgi:hypothetical protein